MTTTFSDIEAAYARIRADVVETPLVALPGAPGVYVKLEPFQHTGSFKFRGAMNRLRLLTPDEAARGVVAFSSGNHGLAVANAARRLGISAVIVVPSDAPAVKRAGIAAAGARLIVYDRNSQDRAAIAGVIAREEGRAVIEPFDHAQTIAGQGTMAIEAARQARALGAVFERLVCGCSGGGLLAGVSLAARAYFPEIEIIGVEPEAQADTFRSLTIGAPTEAEATRPTICDALMSPRPGNLTFAINAKLVSRVALVSDEEVLAAMRHAFSTLKAVIEPGGAVGLAALLAGKCGPEKPTLVIASGGNVDGELYAAMLRGEPVTAIAG